MQILEIGILTSKKNNKKLARGFSLIEILVVLVIIGIFIGTTVLSINTAGVDRDLEWEAFRINSLINLMNEEAIVRNKNFGLLFTKSSYHLYLYDNNRKIWYTPTDENLLSSRDLRESISLSLLIEDREINLEAGLNLNNQETISPHVIFFSSGEAMPFKIYLNRNNSLNRYIINIDSSSKIDLIEDFIDT